MTSAVEPLSLRLPKDLLVLESQQSHLGIEPVLLTPGLRCAIGSGPGCAVRLTNSELVHFEHCVIEALGRRTMLSFWTQESTWLNDRLVQEPTELVAGDRIAIGPFDFRIRPASAEELLYARLVEEEPHATNTIDDVLRLKRAIDKSGRELTSASGTRSPSSTSDLITELSGPNTDASEAESGQQLTQHISKLLSNLQAQILTLQGREAELTEELDRQQITTTARPEAANRSSHAADARAPWASPDRSTASPDQPQAWNLLQAEREQLVRDRQQLAEDQARWDQIRRELSDQMRLLEAQQAELAAKQQSLHEEQAMCQTLANELLRDKARLADWEDRLKQQEQQLTLDRQMQERCHLKGTRQLLPATRPADNDVSGSASRPNFPAPVVRPSHWQATPHATAEETLEQRQNSHQTLRTIATLLLFVMAAVLFEGRVGGEAVGEWLGWTTAIVAALSTVELLTRRYFSHRR